MKILRKASKQPNLLQVYSSVKKTCQFQKNFSCCLLVIFFLLQYSVPVLLVVLGSVTTSRDQLNLFFRKASQQNLEGVAANDSPTINRAQADILVSRIIFLIGLITILLGVINNITRPAESYDISTKFHNRFCKFENDLNLQILQIGGLPDEGCDEKIIKMSIDLLLKQNNELFQLIDEFNDARSLSPRQANIQLLNQSENNIPTSESERNGSQLASSGSGSITS